MPINHEKLAHFLSWDGEVGRSFHERIIKYGEVVRLHAPIDPTNTGHHLADDIDYVLDHSPGHDLDARVGINVNQDVRGYAQPVVQGAKPHIIRPRTPGKLLRFKVAGKIVFARQVRHPGNEPDTFLTDHLGEITR